MSIIPKKTGVLMDNTILIALQTESQIRITKKIRIITAISKGTGCDETWHRNKETQC